jgi:uncharacterized protein DUF5676
MPIRPLPFANALALTTACLAMLLLILRWVAPSVFVFFFNAQFFGADVAMLLPDRIDVPSLIAELAALVGGAWGFGFLGAVLYNRFIKVG